MTGKVVTADGISRNRVLESSSAKGETHKEGIIERRELELLAICDLGNLEP